MSEKLGKIQGMTTQSTSVLMEAAMTMLLTMIIAFFFSWRVTLVVIAITPLQMVGSIINMRLYHKKGPAMEGKETEADRLYK